MRLFAVEFVFYIIIEEVLLLLLYGVFWMYGFHDTDVVGALMAWLMIFCPVVTALLLGIRKLGFMGGECQESCSCTLCELSNRF